MPHVGGFAGHVGAGDDQHPVAALVQGGVVGHKQAAFQHLLNDRVAALGDVQHVAAVHHGFGVVVADGRLGKAGQHVQLGHAGGGFLDAQDLGRDGREQVGKQLVLQNQQPLVGAEDLVFQLFQFRGDVPLAGGQGLLAGKGIRHAVGVRAADLDVVAEHLVEADLQLGDAGLLPQAGLHLGEEALAAVHDVPQLVHLGVVAGADGAAVLEVCRRVVHDGAAHQRQDIRQRVDAGGQVSQQRGVQSLGDAAHLRQGLAGVGQGADLPRGGGAVQDAGGQPLDVKHPAQRLFQVGAGDVFLIQRVHRVQPGVDGAGVHQRLLDPAAQQPLAHGGLGLVQHPQKGALFLAAAHRLGQFQVGAGHGG